MPQDPDLLKFQALPHSHSQVVSPYPPVETGQARQTQDNRRRAITCRATCRDDLGTTRETSI